MSKLKSSMQTMIRKFVKKKELDAANTAYKIAKVDVLSIDHQVTGCQIDVGFATAATLAKRLKEKKISELQMLEFRRECCTMLATIVTKFQERSPLKHLLARKLASLDPRAMVLYPAEATKMFQKVLGSFIELKWKRSEQTNTVLAQYRKFVSDVKQYHEEKFVSFRVREDRLDYFPYEEHIEKREFKDLWTLSKQLLALSHGQASVERLFSVNKEVVASNIEEVSLTSIRLVQNSMLVNNMKVADFVITEYLLSSCIHASGRHKMYLLEKTAKEQTEKAKTEKSFTRKTYSSKEEREGATELQSKWLKQLTKSKGNLEKKRYC